MYAVKYKDLETGENELSCMTFSKKVAIDEVNRIKRFYYKSYEAKIVELSFWKMLFGLEKIDLN